MQSILCLILFIIFLSISLLHVWWAIFGIDDVTKLAPQLPGRPTHPPVYMTLLVALGLFAIAVFYLWKADMVSIELGSFFTNYLGWIISGIFLLRAIGDFNYVGLFSKKRNTKFDKLDRKYYSPLSLFIGVVGVLIEVLF